MKGQYSIWILLSQFIECFRESNVCQNQALVKVSCESPFDIMTVLINELNSLVSSAFDLRPLIC